jgi:hypothetical protein
MRARAITTLSRKAAESRPPSISARWIMNLATAPRLVSSRGPIPRIATASSKALPMLATAAGPKLAPEVGRYALIGISAAPLHRPSNSHSAGFGRAGLPVNGPLFSVRDATRCCMPLPVADEIRRRALPHRELGETVGLIGVADVPVTLAPRAFLRVAE